MSALDKPPVEALQRIHLLNALSEQELAELRRSMRVRELGEGERLFDFGQPATCFYYLTRGQIKLSRDSADGAEKVIELVRPRETFAEAVMFMEHVKGYPVSAEAIEPSEVYAFDSDTMVRLLRDSMDTCFRLMACMSRRLRHHVDEIDRLTLHNATFRLADFLLREAPEDHAPDTEVHLRMPKHVLASRLAVQPETFSRILARLSREGILSVKRQDIVVRDLSALRELAGGP